MRFVEIALLAAPFLVFAVWRLMAPDAGPPRALVFAVTGAVLVMAAILLVLRQEDAMPPDAAYIPPRQEGGHIVPGRMERGVPVQTDHTAPGGAETEPQRVEPPRESDQPGAARRAEPGRAGQGFPAHTEQAAPERRGR